jgi:UMF1 family MFS transporter
MYVHEKNQAISQVGHTIYAGVQKLLITFKKIKNLREVFLFLLAYWCYIDGVDTIIRMAVNYGQSLHLNQKDLVLALLITQFIGFPAAIVFGGLGKRWGAKTGIFIALFVYIIVTIWAYFMQSEREFYILAIVIGLVQGGIQSLSRSLFTRIIPGKNSGELFGFYNMLGKFAAVLGPFTVGLVSQVSGNPRLGILVLVVFFVVGGILLYYVDEGKARNTAIIGI